MTEQSFTLIPFPAPDVPGVNLTGSISRWGSGLSLHYFLAGEIDEILLPSLSANPGRRDELWKMTCFEFFLAVKDQPQYWEFNMSPSGDWNVYRMEAYRRVGFREETSIPRLPFEVREGRNGAGGISLAIAVDLKPIIDESYPLDIGVTSILQARDGNETYWALTHPAPNADFHLRESFILTLAGQNHPVPGSAPAS
jgi:hypothetical protein